MRGSPAQCACLTRGPPGLLSGYSAAIARRARRSDAERRRDHTFVRVACRFQGERAAAHSDAEPGNEDPLLVLHSVQDRHLSRRVRPASAASENVSPTGARYTRGSGVSGLVGPNSRSRPRISATGIRLSGGRPTAGDRARLRQAVRLAEARTLPRRLRPRAASRLSFALPTRAGRGADSARSSPTPTPTPKIAYTHFVATHGRIASSARA
jgi:hypothetical protein